MPDYKSHVEQAEHNLRLIEFLNNKQDDFWDWKVTISFYTALHIINAHLDKVNGLHYAKHSTTFIAINPIDGVAKVSEDIFAAYNALQNLSRKARYLNDSKNGADLSKALNIYEKHFAKAIRHLDRLIKYFESLYTDMSISTINVQCSYLNHQDNLSHFIKIS